MTPGWSHRIKLKTFQIMIGSCELHPISQLSPTHIRKVKELGENSTGRNVIMNPSKLITPHYLQ